MSSGSLSEEITKKLSEAIPDVYLLSKLLVFLSGKPDEVASYINILERTFNIPKLFEETAKQLAKEAAKALDDDKYKEFMSILYSNYLDPAKKVIGDKVCLDLEAIAKNPSVVSSLQFNLVRSLSQLDPAQLSLFISQAESIARLINPSLGALVEVQAGRALSFLSKTSGKIVSYGLAAVFLTYDVFTSIYRWYKGEITGKRCLKLIIDSSASVAAGIGGGFAGSAIGTVFGPAGMILGGVIGGLVGSTSVNIISDWLTSNLFNIPKDVAVENAYAFLGLKQNSSNPEINSKFRELCLKYHPDKGGKVEDFHKLQYSMSLVKFSRGEKA